MIRDWIAAFSIKRDLMGPEFYDWRYLIVFFADLALHTLRVPRRLLLPLCSLEQRMWSRRNIERWKREDPEFYEQMERER